MTLTMPKTFKENLTNWLISIIAFAGALWVNKVIDNQSKIIDKIENLSVLMATANSERKALQDKVIEIDKTNEKQNERLDKIQGISSTEKNFKHEDLFTLN
jgi:hypothetical protein